MAHSDSGNKLTTATVTIDGQTITVPAETTILDAAAALGITIPTLCWLKKISATGACRICIVKVEGIDRFMTACNTPVKDGIIVTTSSPELEDARKKTLELMLVNHPLDCPVCDAAGECDLQDSCYNLHVDKNKFHANLERLPIRYDWKLLESDPNRCILCEKCVKVCREVTGREAIEIVDRGDNTVIDTKSGKPLDCDFCGNCVAACPTGTLISKPFKFSGRPWTFEVTNSVCAFCSSGCPIEYHSKDGKIGRVTSSDDAFNKGNLCINGRFGYSAFNSPQRITTALINGQKSTWEEALRTVSGALKDIIAVNGSESVAAISSPRITNEENYLFQKLMRGAIGTNNIDSEARLGYFPSQLIQYKMLGYSGGSFPMDAIETASAIVVLGSDLKAESAGFAYRVIQASTKNNAKLVIANSSATSLNKYANSFLQYRPGTEAWLICGLKKAILSENGADKDFITKNTNDFEAFKGSLDAVSFEQIKTATGIHEQELKAAAKLIACKKTAILYGAEVVKSADMNNAVSGAVNLALITGAVGENGAGIYPLDEKNNTQGMLDMGVCPEYLPGYHTYSAMSEQFGKAWNTTLPATEGKNLFQIIDAIEAGTIKALYVVGSNPLRFMTDGVRVENALKKLKLLIVQDLYLTETAKLATVFLPAATGAEKSGSFTSIDNRVQSFTAAIAPAGDSKTDGDIFNRLYSQLASVTPLKTLSEKELDYEITTLTGLYHEECNADFCTIWRTKNRTAFESKKAQFATVKPLSLKPADTAYPFILTFGTLLHHNGSYTTWSANNMLVAGQAFVAINPLDASAAGINEGTAVTLTSKNGSITLPAQLNEALQPGALFIPSHFKESAFGTLITTNTHIVAVALKK